MSSCVTFFRNALFLFSIQYLKLVFAVENSILTAYFSENGLQGIISINKGLSDDVVIISSSVKILQDNNTNNCNWHIRQLPVDYTNLNGRCDDRRLGNLAVNLTSMFGVLKLNEQVEFSASVDVFPITGSEGIWQSSIVLELPNGRRACSTLSVTESADLKVAKSKFYGPVFGNIHFMWIGITGSVSDAVILTDLRYLHKNKLLKSEHSWGIYVNDILDTDRDKGRHNCDALQLSYNGLSDLGKKLGKLKMGKSQIFRGASIVSVDLSHSDHTYYVAIYDDVHKDKILSCSPVIVEPITVLRTMTSINSTKWNLTLSQKSQFDPTKITVDLYSPYIHDLGGIRIHTLPSTPRLTPKQSKMRCHAIKDVYNPTSAKVGADASIPGSNTQDEYAIGDLTGKIGYDTKVSWDIFLPLSGRHSVMHRSAVLYRNGMNGEEPWSCSTILPFAKEDSVERRPMKMAEIIFQYPLAGRIIFRQLAEHEYSDTVMIVEYMVHSDGTSVSDTFNHNWTINVNPPSKDYYDWQNRCLSTGNPFDPYKIKLIDSLEELVTSYSFAHLASTLGPLSIAGEKSRSDEISRSLYVAGNIRLSGPNSIIGKSFVIYDENGPEARGNRLACSRIEAVHRRKAVIRDWFGNGEPTKVSGKIEIYQESEYDDVGIEIDLEGVHGISQYHVHMTPVEEQLEFPCENSSLYGVWNPWNIIPTNDRNYDRLTDQIRAGDWSMKFGYWDNMTIIKTAYNHSDIQLFGQTSILDRSFVLHKIGNKKRAVCATIERGYAPSDARELRAIASFHHPLGFVYGYIRMTQLIHFDGSKSETVIEVNLKHGGKNNRNVTHNHKWFVYVNPVGADAIVQVKDTRCTAAGYVWNPDFIQLADPLNTRLYGRECGPELPFRCYAGDISGRLGTISIGVERTVFSDPNLPLEGKVTIMGKSIVIFDKNNAENKYACANIEPDKDIIKYANIRRTLRFVVSQFLLEVREAMGIPEWMLTIDNRKTKILHDGACTQVLLHFKGPEANKIEQDFTRLLRVGQLKSPSIFIPGYNAKPSNKKINFQDCPRRDSNDKGSLSGGATKTGLAMGAYIFMIFKFVAI